MGIVVAIVIATTLAAWHLSCDVPYTVTVEFTRTGNTELPFAASGSIEGCGLRRWFAGRSGFYFALRPGARPSGSRATHGNDVITIEAAIAQDGRSGWYTANVEHNGKTISLGRETVPLLFEKSSGGR